MSNQDGPGGTHGEDVDPGQPIQALAALSYRASPGFFARVRNRIQRRHLASHIVDLSFSAPGLVLLEFLRLLLGFFVRDESPKGGPGGWNRQP